MPTATKRAAKKAAPAPEPEIDETEVDETELDELEEDEVEETAPKKKGSAAQEVTFGASDLAKHLSTGRDKPVSARELRTLIRKMARDGKGRVTREITPGNRTRYNWSGVKDPEVQAIIAAFNAGELDADKAEKLQALKDRKAAQPKATKTTKSTKASKKAAPVVEEDEDEELELEEE